MHRSALALPAAPRAFTLIELLVAISIIALLIGLLLPVLGSARRVARQSVCMSQLRQIEIAHTIYQVENDGRLLPTSHTRSWIEVLRAIAPELVFRSPADTSPHFAEGSPVPPGTAFRQTSYAINVRLDPDRVSTGPSDPAFRRLTDLPQPSNVVHASVKVFSGANAASDHFHPRSWTHLNPAFVAAFAANELATAAHGGTAGTPDAISTYGFPDGHAEATRFAEQYRGSAQASRFKAGL